MLTIWGRENSVNVKKVLWCAAELQLVFNFIPAGANTVRIRMPLLVAESQRAGPLPAG
ncbi:hypothetical protein SODG_000375 [Sodalis praecaptivus]